MAERARARGPATRCCALASIRAADEGAFELLVAAHKALTELGHEIGRSATPADLRAGLGGGPSERARSLACRRPHLLRLLQQIL